MKEIGAIFVVSTSEIRTVQLAAIKRRYIDKGKETEYLHKLWLKSKRNKLVASSFNVTFNYRCYNGGGRAFFSLVDPRLKVFLLHRRVKRLRRRREGCKRIKTGCTIPTAWISETSFLSSRSVSLKCLAYQHIRLRFIQIFKAAVCLNATV